MPSKDEKNQNFNLDSSSLLNDKEIRSEFKFKDDWIPDKAKKGYHEQRLSQSKWAFRLSFWGSIIGFLVIVQGIRNSTGLNNVEWAGIISGTVIEAVSALFYGLSNKANEKVPGLSKGIMVKKNHYNQGICDHTVLIEFGGQSNTKEEVQNTIEVMSQVIKEYLQ